MVPDGTPKRFSFRVDAAVRETVISPDGEHIAYVEILATENSIWVQDLDQDEPRKLLDAEGTIRGISWSPDSNYIAYVEGQRLMRVPQQGGLSRFVSEWAGLGRSGSTWSPDGESIVFDSVDNGPLRRIYIVPAQGGSAKLLFEPDSSLHERGYYFPHYLPSAAGRILLYSVSEGSERQNQIVARDLETAREQTLANGTRPFYSPSGHVVYESEPGSVWALPFSIRTLEATGEPFPIRENGSRPSVARDGSLVYLSSGAVSAMQQLTWVDSNGQELGAIGQPQELIRYPALSPDETRVAVAGLENGDFEVWVHDVDRPVKTRITSSPGVDWRPLWSANGNAMLFSSQRGGSARHRIYRKASDGTGEVQLLYSTDQFNNFASDWSADGRYVVYDVNEGSTDGTDIWYLKRQGDGTFAAEPFLATSSVEKAARISPAGRWLAYVSDESGESEVYVQRFPEGGDKVRISYDGGGQPLWSRSGTDCTSWQTTPCSPRKSSSE